MVYLHGIQEVQLPRDPQGSKDAHTVQLGAEHGCMAEEEIVGPSMQWCGSRSSNCDSTWRMFEPHRNSVKRSTCRAGSNATCMMLCKTTDRFGRLLHCMISNRIIVDDLVMRLVFVVAAVLGLYFHPSLHAAGDSNTSWHYLSRACKIDSLTKEFQYFSPTYVDTPLHGKESWDRWNGLAGMVIQLL